MSLPDDPARQRVITLSVDVFVTLGILALFMALSFTLIAPFASILIWSVILAVALAPAFDWMNAKMGGRRGRTDASPEIYLVTSFANARQYFAPPLQRPSF